jgi:hypothetical protein
MHKLAMFLDPSALAVMAPLIVMLSVTYKPFMLIVVPPLIVHACSLLCVNYDLHGFTRQGISGLPCLDVEVRVHIIFAFI